MSEAEDYGSSSESSLVEEDEGLEEESLSGQATEDENPESGEPGSEEPATLRPAAAKAKGKGRGRTKKEWEVVRDPDIDAYIAWKLSQNPGAAVNLTQTDFNKIKALKRQGGIPAPAEGAAPRGRYRPRSLKTIEADAVAFQGLEEELMAEGLLLTADATAMSENLVKAIEEENANRMAEHMTLEKRGKYRRRHDASRFVSTIIPGAEIVVDVWVTQENPAEGEGVLKRIAKAAGFKFTEFSADLVPINFKARTLDALSEQEMWLAYGEYFGERRKRLEELEVLMEAAQNSLKWRDRLDELTTRWEAQAQDESLDRVTRLRAQASLKKVETVFKAQLTEEERAQRGDSFIELPNLLEAEEAELVAKIEEIKTLRDSIGAQERKLVPSAAPDRIEPRNKALLERRNRLEKLEAELLVLEGQLERVLVTPPAAEASSEDLFGDASVERGRPVNIRELFDEATVGIQARINLIRGEMDRLAIDVSERKVRPYEVSEYATAERKIKTICLASTVSNKPWVLNIKKGGGLVVADSFEIKGDKATITRGRHTRVVAADEVGVLFGADGEGREPNRFRKDMPHGKMVLVSYRPRGGKPFPVVAVITEVAADGCVVRPLLNETVRAIVRQSSILTEIGGPEATIALKTLDERKKILGFGAATKIPTRLKFAYEDCRQVLYETFRIVTPTPERVYTDSLRSTVEKLYYDSLRAIIRSPSGAATAPESVSFESYVKMMARKEATVTVRAEVMPRKSFFREAEALSKRENLPPKDLIQVIIRDFDGAFSSFTGKYASRSAFDAEFSRDTVYKLAAKVITKPDISAVTQRFIAALASAPSGVGAAGIMAEAINAHVRVCSALPISHYEERLARADVAVRSAAKIEALAAKLRAKPEQYRKRYRAAYDEQGLPRASLGATPTSTITPTEFALDDATLQAKVRSLVGNYQPPPNTSAKAYLESGVLFPLIFLRGGLAESVAYARTKIACGDYAVEHLHLAKTHHLFPEAMARFMMPEKTELTPESMVKKLAEIQEYFVMVAIGLSEGLAPSRDLFDPIAIPYLDVEGPRDIKIAIPGRGKGKAKGSSYIVPGGPQGAAVSTAVAAGNLGKFKTPDYPDIRVLVSSLMNPVEACRISTNTGLTFRSDDQPPATDAKKNVSSDLIVCYDHGNFVCKDKRELAAEILIAKKQVDERVRKVVLAAYPTVESIPASFSKIGEPATSDIRVGQAKEKEPRSANEPSRLGLVTRVWMPGTVDTKVVLIEEGDSQRPIVVSPHPPPTGTLAVLVGGSGSVGSRPEVVASVPRPASRSMSEMVAEIFGKPASKARSLNSFIADRIDVAAAAVTNILSSTGKVSVLEWRNVARQVLEGDSAAGEVSDPAIAKALSSPAGKGYLISKIAEVISGSDVYEVQASEVMTAIASSSSLDRETVAAVSEIAAAKGMARFTDRLLALVAKVDLKSRAGLLSDLKSASVVGILGWCERVLGPYGSSTIVTDLPVPKAATLVAVREYFLKIYRRQTPDAQISAAVAAGVYPPTKPEEVRALVDAVASSLDPKDIASFLRELPVNFIGSLRYLTYLERLGQ